MIVHKIGEKLFTACVITLTVIIPVMVLSQLPLRNDQHYQSIMEYIRPPFGSSLDASYFSVEDRLHMVDVRNVFRVVYLVFIAAATVALAILLGRPFDPGLLQMSTRAVKRVIILGLIAGVVALVFWTQVFTLFHQILFPNNNYWSLDPTTSNLIKYFPNGTFQIFGVFYIFIVWVEYLILKRFAAKTIP